MPSVSISQDTVYDSATKTNQLILFREAVAVYCENHTKHTNTLFSSPSQETHHVSSTDTNQLVLTGERLGVYCENHIEHTNTECGHTVRLMFVKAAGIYLPRYFKH
jgi:hypothetical protein